VPKVSVTIITLNEADHITAAIDSASWADETIIVDSGRTDDTVAIPRAKALRTMRRTSKRQIDIAMWMHPGSRRKSTDC
jgi:hypothetical protein